MAILLGCEDGLYEYSTALQQLTCPLEHISAIACGSGIAVADSVERTLWDGRRLTPVDPGIESLLLWRGNILTLSSETDCLTLIDGQNGTPVTLAPTGVCPQHMCFLQQDTVAVCGGADGCIRILALPSLHILAQYHVPGAAARVLAMRGDLLALCTVENGDLQCLLCRIHMRGGRCEPLLTLPGLPGAVSGDDRGGCWAAAGEMLYHIPPGSKTPDSTHGGFGLISHIAQTPHGLLLCDPALDQCCLLQHGRRTVIRSGGICCAAVL